MHESSRNTPDRKTVSGHCTESCSLRPFLSRYSLPPQFQLACKINPSLTVKAMIETTSDAVPKPRRGKAAATMVAAGILLSRLSGLIQFRLFAHYLGTSVAADAYRAAFRVPNLLQNLLGEGVLSASFIPVYARLRAEGKDEEASRVARAVGTLLALVASLVALLGIVFARALVEVLAPGFESTTRELAITLVKILFPGVALLVMSA